MHGEGAALPDRGWALCAGFAGISAVLGYALAILIDGLLPLTVLLLAVFALGLALASISLHLGVTRAVSPRLSLLAAVANTAAVVELLAMLLVQLAVKAAAPHPGNVMTAIWLGLDVAWDIFVGAGTVLFGIVLWRHPRVGRILAAVGVALGVVLLVLNIGTFPVPPAEAGLFDVGPFIALWYVALMVRVLWLAWPAQTPPLAAPAAEPALEALTGVGADR